MFLKAQAFNFSHIFFAYISLNILFNIIFHIKEVFKLCYQLNIFNLIKKQHLNSIQWNYNILLYFIIINLLINNYFILLIQYK